MAISAYSMRYVWPVAKVSVTSNLSGDAFFHWWRDGQYIGLTTVPEITVSALPGVAFRMYCYDTTDPDFDYLAVAPEDFPPVRGVEWVRSASTDVVSYLIELLNPDNSQWEEVERVPIEVGAWLYRWTTPRLPDLKIASVRVSAVDEVGNRSITPTVVFTETIITRPDPPLFLISGGGEGITFTDPGSA